MTDDKLGLNRVFEPFNSRGLTGKREYVRSLELRRDDEALSLLVECLCDESWYLRDLAEASLVRIGEPAAAVLLPMLEQGLWFTRTSSARVLGRLAHRPAVPTLLRLFDDANETVADAARDALVAIGQHGGAFRIAWELHRLPPEERRRGLDDLAARDRHLGEILTRLMGHDDLMQRPDGDRLGDDNPAIKASEEGFEWEVLTGAPGPRPPTPGAGGGPSSSA